MDAELHTFFTSTLDGNEWSSSRPQCIITAEGFPVRIEWEAGDGGGCPITDLDSFEGRKRLRCVGNRKRFLDRARSLDTNIDCAIFHSCTNSQISACSSWTFLPNGASSETWISEQNSKTLFSVTQNYVFPYFLVLLSFYFILFFG